MERLEKSERCKRIAALPYASCMLQAGHRKWGSLARCRRYLPSNKAAAFGSVFWDRVTGHDGLQHHDIEQCVSVALEDGS